jgi:hypothetical protein
MARRMSSCDDAFYAPLFEIWRSFRVKRSSHAPSDSPVTAACTAQKLFLNACEIVVYGENHRPHLPPLTLIGLGLPIASLQRSKQTAHG